MKSNNKLMTVCLIVILQLFHLVNHLSQGKLLEVPQNTTVENGRNVTLPCKTDLQFTVFWYFNEHEIYYGGQVAMSYKDRYQVEPAANGQYNLIIAAVDSSYEGRYTCADDEGQGEKRWAILTVTDSVAEGVPKDSDTSNTTFIIIIVIVAVVAVLLAGLIGVIIYIYCCRKRCCPSKDSDQHGVTKTLLNMSNIDSTHKPAGTTDRNPTKPPKEENSHEENHVEQPDGEKEKEEKTSDTQNAETEQTAKRDTVTEGLTKNDSEKSTEKLNQSDSTRVTPNIDTPTTRTEGNTKKASTEKTEIQQSQSDKSKNLGVEDPLLPIKETSNLPSDDTGIDTTPNPDRRETIRNFEAKAKHNTDTTQNTYITQPGLSFISNPTRDTQTGKTYTKTAGHTDKDFEENRETQQSQSGSRKCVLEENANAKKKKVPTAILR